MFYIYCPFFVQWLSGFCPVGNFVMSCPVSYVYHINQKMTIIKKNVLILIIVLAIALALIAAVWLYYDWRIGQLQL